MTQLQLTLFSKLCRCGQGQLMIEWGWVQCQGLVRIKDKVFFGKFLSLEANICKKLNFKDANQNCWSFWILWCCDVMKCRCNYQKIVCDWESKVNTIIIILICSAIQPLLIITYDKRMLFLLHFIHTLMNQIYKLYVKIPLNTFSRNALYKFTTVVATVLQLVDQFGCLGIEALAGKIVETGPLKMLVRWKFFSLVRAQFPPKDMALQKFGTTSGNWKR